MTDFVQGFFVGSTFLFWVVIAVEVLILFACIEYERVMRGFVSLIITFFLLEFLFNINIVQYLLQNPLKTAIWTLGYLVAGVLYAVFRWDLKGAKWRRQYDESNTYSHQSTQDLLKNRPQAKNSKNLIIVWMMYWPVSATWWLISDFVRELFVSIYYKLLTVLDRISERHTKGIDIGEKAKR